jgi:hypothetical protein
MPKQYTSYQPMASIYIPRVNTRWNEQHIRDTMKFHKIGYVTHVDITPVNKKHGFYEEILTTYMSVFIHFAPESEFINYNTNQAFWNSIFNVNGYGCRIPVTSDEYWICLLNNNPIQRTRMNIHQVVENGRYLENLIMCQAAEIEKMKMQLDKLTSFDCPTKEIERINAELDKQKKRIVS